MAYDIDPTKTRQPNSDRLKVLYDALKEDGADVGDSWQFRDWMMADENNRKTVWQAFKDDGADVGEYDEFDTWLYDLGQQPTAATQQPTQRNMGTPGYVPNRFGLPTQQQGVTPMMGATPPTPQPQQSRRQYDYRPMQGGGSVQTPAAEQPAYRPQAAPKPQQPTYQQAQQQQPIYNTQAETPATPEFRNTQKMYSDAADKAWQKAEQDTKALREANTKKIEDIYNDEHSTMLGKMAMAQTRATALPIEGMAASLKAHDMEKMANDAWGYVSDEDKEYLLDGFMREIMREAARSGGSGGTMSQEEAEKALREEAERRAKARQYQAMYDKAVAANAPKDVLDFLQRKIVEGNSLSKLAIAAARTIAGTRGDMDARAVATHDYGKGHRVADIAGSVLQIATDPVTWASGGVGKAATKGVTMLAGKAIQGASTLKRADMIARALPLSQRMIGGSANFAAFEGLGNTVEQLQQGGVYNEETGQYEYSLKDVAKAAGHGVLLGSATGVVGGLVGNVGDKVFDRVASTAGKLAVRGGQTLTSIAAEGTIFAAPELISGEGDFDTWLESVELMAGFKLHHGLKALPGTMGRLMRVPESRAGFETRLRDLLQGRPDLALTNDEREELERGGYTDLSELAEAYKGIEGKLVRMGDEMPYDRFSQLMADNSISEAARAKMYYYVTGRGMVQSTVTAAEIAEHRDHEGNITDYVVKSYNKDGGVITSRTYKSKKAAEVEFGRLTRQSELNSIDMLEKLYDRLPGTDATTAKMLRDVIGRESGIDIDKVIGKEENRRTDEEKAALQEYLNTMARECQDAWDRQHVDVNQQRLQPDWQEAYDMGYNADEQQRSDISIEREDNPNDPQAQAAWQGVEDRIRQDAADRADQRRAEGERMAYKGKGDMQGMLRPLTINEESSERDPETGERIKKTVYLVNGTIAIEPNGNGLSREGTDKTIYVYDPETGETHELDPFGGAGVLSVGDIVSMDDYLAQNEQQSQAEVQQEIDNATGKVNVQPNTPFVTPEGRQGIVKSVEGDNVIVQFADGNMEEASIPMADLQQYADALRRQEYEARHPQETPAEQPQQPNTATEGQAPTATAETPQGSPTVSPTQTAQQTGAAAQPQVEYPRDKQGNIDYDKIGDAATFATALGEEFGEDAPATLDDIIAEETAKMDKQNAVGKARIRKRLAMLEEAKAQLTPSEEAPAEAPTAEVEQPTAQITPQAGEVPDMSVDKASDARARGYRMQSGVRYDRQGATEGVVGSETEVKFTNKEKPVKGRWKVVEAGSVQPSHVGGQNNPLHFITEAQPKDRTDKVSDAESDKIAAHINPKEIIDGVTAYTGAPVVNSRGEVIQGNNRATALRKMGSYPESAAKYKQYLIDHAADYGLNAEDIAKMQNPIMVREVDVTDEEAIRLGQFTASDTESGGKERISADKVLGKLTDEQTASVLNIMLRGGEETDETLMQLIDRNGADVLTYLAGQGAINDTQVQSAYGRDGRMTPEAKNDLADMVTQNIFKGGADNIKKVWNEYMPVAAQKALLQAMAGDMRLPVEDRLIKYVRNAIMAVGEIKNNPFTKDAKTAEEYHKGLDMDARQADMLSRPIKERYSELELYIAVDLLLTKKQNAIKAIFWDYQRLFLEKGADLFEAPKEYTPEEAIEKVFGIKLNKTDNNEQGNDPGGSHETGTSETGETAGNGELGRGERSPEGESGTAGQAGEQAAVSKAETAQQPKEEAEGGTGTAPQPVGGVPAQSETPAEQPRAAVGEGENNEPKEPKRLISDEQMDELKERLRKKLRGQLNSGIDPETLSIGLQLAVGHIERGLTKFADFAKRMIEDLGDAIRPYLKSFYNGARDFPGAEKLAEQMTPYDEVRTFDVENFDKSRPSSIVDTAKEIAAEQEIEKQVEKIKKPTKGNKKEDSTLSNTEQGQLGLFGSPSDTETETPSESNLKFTEEQRAKVSEKVMWDMLRGLTNGEKPYKSVADIRKMAQDAGLDVDMDGRDDVALQEMVEDGLVRAARQIIERGKYGDIKSRMAYEAICELYDLQPTISRRSDNRVKMQQYSTPLPMAFVADMFAWKPNGRVLEPTAGNGMLVFAIPAKNVVVNELDETRLANLRQQGFEIVLNEDATSAAFTPKAYDSVIANPPFGKAEAKEYDGKSIAGLDEQIALNALSAMKDNGKAAIIIGGNMEYGSNGAIKGNKAFWTYLYDHYNVKGVVDMAGKLYAKQGTTYPTRMILIDGRRSEEERAQSTIYPPRKHEAIRKAETFNDLYDIVTEVSNTNKKTNGNEVLRTSSSPVTADTDNEAWQPVKVGHNGKHNADAGDGQNGGTRPTDSRGSGESNKPTEQRPTKTTERPSVGGTELTGNAGVSKPQGDNGGNAVRGGERGGSGRAGDTERVQHDGVRGNGNAAGGVRLTEQRETEKRTLTEEKLSYRPHNSAFSLQSVAPAAMVEAMDKSLAEIENTWGNIDEFVTNELGYDSVDEMHNALAAEQVDSVAMAIFQMQQGKAMIIGDQTGVGKGRQMAALIRWAHRHGKKPIFITQKADLFSDLYRDLVDVGSGNLRPFIFNSDGAIVDGDGKVVHKPMSPKEQAKVFANGKLPDDYDFALLTYSQVNTGDMISSEAGKGYAKESGNRSKKTNAEKNNKPTPKATFLRSIAQSNYLFLDESHTAAGDSNVGAYIRSIIGTYVGSQAGYAQGVNTGGVAGVTFASATFAKRPDTMPMYAMRTAMSEANVEPYELISIIARGGVTLQEIMSRALTESGQMVRRERDMSDVRTDWETIDNPELVQRARENYDKTIVAFNAIIKFQEDYVTPMIAALDAQLSLTAGSANVKKGTKKMGVENTPFASKTYNYTKQLMLALKVDAIVDRVEQEIKAGRHPVIALESTMEASIKDYNAGDVIGEPTFSASLLKGLDSCMQYTVKDENGKETHFHYDPSDLGPDGERAYYELQEFIRQSTSGVFISPLDAIIEKLHERGYKVGELTGRNSYVEREADGSVVVKKRTDKDKKRMQRDFNSGALDVLILNKSASTGISLHASEKFSDQRQRSMIIAQPLSDINDYMQMIGRIDRTGQVHRGYYINLGLPVPAESRFLMMLSTKLKSLNANTTTSQESESSNVEAPDLLNKYGSQVIVEYLRDNPDIYVKMGEPLKKSMGQSLKANELDTYEAPKNDEVARKITGYVALLNTKEQEDFYNDVVRRYTDLIKYLDSTGTNDLKITVMPLKAKTLSKNVSSEGKDPNGNNPFAQNAYVEEVEMDVLRKPMKADEIRKSIEQLNTLQGTEKGHFRTASEEKTAGERALEIAGVVEREEAAKLAAEEERHAAALQTAEAAIAKRREKLSGQQNISEEEKAEKLAEYTAETMQKVNERHEANMNKIRSTTYFMKEGLRRYSVGKTYILPQESGSEENTASMFTSPAIFCGYKVKDSKLTPSTSFAVFATLDGRRRIEVKFTDNQTNSQIGFLTSSNYAQTQQVTLDNWDSHVPTNTRKKGYIMTGNILQAVSDTQDEATGAYVGQLISYTDEEGNIHDGVLMPDRWQPAMLKTSGVPILARLAQLLRGGSVTSTDGKVTITTNRYGDGELSVPKTKKEGEKYFTNETILSAISGGFWEKGGKFNADIVGEDNIRTVVTELSNMGVRVKSDTEADSEVRFRNLEESDNVVNNAEAGTRPLTDREKIAKLESEPKVKVYRSMQLIDGKLYPPMSARVDGQLREPSEIGVWEEAEEHPELADENGKFKLDKGNKKSLKAAYNPYIHTSRTMLNDQFSEAQSRPNLVVVEVEIPESELNGTYRAEKAKDSVGAKQWKAGVIQGQLSGTREVILSRWAKPIRIVPDAEVAENIARQIEGQVSVMPSNVVTPQVRAELEKRGVRFVETDNTGRLTSGSRKGETWAQVYGKNATKQREGGEEAAQGDWYERGSVERIGAFAGYTPKQIAKMNARQEQTARNKFSDAAEKLHLGDRITFVDTIDEIEGIGEEQRKAWRRKKGWYSPRTGKIVIILGNHKSMDDVMKSIMHEGVAHHGLRQMFGKHFDTFLDNVYLNASPEIRGRINEMAKKHGWDFRTATEEYLATLAEDTDFEKPENQSWWRQVKAWFFDMLHKIGFKLQDMYGTITDNELRYILWRSYENLVNPGRFNSVVEEAKDIAKQYELKVGQWDETWSVAAEAEPNATMEYNGRKIPVWAGNGRRGNRADRVERNDRMGSDYNVAAEGVAEDGVRFRDGEEEENDSEERESIEQLANNMSIGTAARFAAVAARNAQESHDNAEALAAALNFTSQNLAEIVKAAKAQKKFDKATVKQVTDMARVMVSAGYLDSMGRADVKGLLKAIRESTGETDNTDNVNRIIDIMVKNQLKNQENTLATLLKIKGSRVDARGINVQGKLDPNGQQTIKAFKDNMKEQRETIESRIANAEERMTSEDRAIADAAYNEKVGLQLALDYVEKIGQSKADEKDIEAKKRAELSKVYDYTRVVDVDEQGNALFKKDGTERTHEVRHVRAEYKGKISDEKKAERERVEQTAAAMDDAIRHMRMERIDAYTDFIAQVAGNMKESMRKLEERREAEKRRIEEIHHNANSDMEGRPASEHRSDTGGVLNWINNTAGGTLFAPLASFGEMLRMFGRKSPNGEGYLFNRFMRGLIDARHKEINGVHDKYSELDRKAHAVFGGKVETWADMMNEVRKGENIAVEWFDGKEMKPHTLHQGNLMYIYMVNKMSDGRMKLRHMGIDEKAMAVIESKLDPRLKEIADWLQDDFLVRSRNEYNETHKRMFGASMSAIEDYFPLVINSGSRNKDAEKEDAAENNPNTITTATGAIKKRTVNVVDLDLLNADAMHVILDHIAEMEHWNAFAEYNRDLNTLRSYKRFENQVKNMTTILGDGEQTWKAFNKTAQIAVGSYQKAQSDLDAKSLEFASKVTAAKVAFRINTALKQLLSLPAYLPYANASGFYHALANDLGNGTAPWKWCMENLPMYRERWESRVSGDPRLLKLTNDWKSQRATRLQKISRAGMLPNAAVDALTVSIGAHAVYETRKAQYLKEGYSEAVAEKRAIQDAEIAYNETQQSSEGGFVSVMQVDKSWLNVLFTIFRNASMAYQRQLHGALRNLINMRTKARREQAKEFLAKQIARDGVNEAQARLAAEQRFNRAMRKNWIAVATFGYIVQFAWNFGGQMWYLLFGDDDDKKKKTWKDILIHSLFGGVEGLTGGDWLSELGRQIATGDRNPQSLNKDMPLTSDMFAIIEKFGQSREWEAVSDIINLVVQAGVGVNPQTLTDIVVATIDACNGDLGLAREAGLWAMRVIQVPQSQTEQIYFDEIGMTGEEARKLSYEQLVERYAKYRVKRNYFWTPWEWDNEKAIEKGEKRGERIVKERMETMSDEQLEEALSNLFESSGEKGKKLSFNQYAKREGLKGYDYSDVTKNDGAKYYMNIATWRDIAEDITLHQETKRLEDEIKRLKKLGVRENEAVYWQTDDKLKDLNEVKKEIGEMKKEMVDANGNPMSEEVINTQMENIRKARRRVLYPEQAAYPTDNVEE